MTKNNSTKEFRSKKSIQNPVTFNRSYRPPFLFISGIILTTFLCAFFISNAYAQQIYTASYYSEASCKKEGTWQKWGGKTASGERFDENDLTAAMWGVPFGTMVKVENIKNGKSVKVRINDRGPSKKLVKQGRIIDLSKQAFFILSNGHLEYGILKVKIEKING